MQDLTRELSVGSDIPGKARAVRRSQSRGRRTRERLLAAARDLFGRDGYEGTSIGEVASEAGVGVGTVYHHFEDKRALLLELLKRQVSEAGERMVDAGEGPLARAFRAADFDESLVEGMHLIRSMRQQEPATSAVALEVARRDPEIDEVCRKIERRFRDFVRGDIVVGVSIGRVRPGIDVDVASHVVWHAFDGVMRVAIETSDEALADALMREMAAMMGRYLLAD